VISAKAVLLSTGGANRLYQNPTGLSFNCWMCPANTEDSEAMAFRAGARLANMEYLRMTVVPRRFSARGLNALVGMGATKRWLGAVRLSKLPRTVSLPNHRVLFCFVDFLLTAVSWILNSILYEKEK
jgi:succinate dehydrogenase/fumarate reductase flavoprotein subunit